ncbi:hypothetical protein FLJC2902T_30750 [Flavobacterium limnosediminis JC2902]|uniref:HNH nuclease domain-containing protein n=2 Tax=Flavobacterium TaxID=237 RepID=V6SG32_9FLAO|nr:hypothetical protein FLJC2902T_30750 [Flavobacterium limnosediminis JC2902]
MRREVRQRCGFGCVICGLPLYEYDHIINYSIVQEHTPENLTLLCDQHHREKTNKLLSIEQVIEANNNPYNVINANTTPYLLNFAGSDFSVILGDIRQFVPNVNSQNDFIIPFLVNNKRLISFEIIEGKLFFNLVLLDEHDNLLLKIVENEMVFSSEQWDVEFVGRRLTIRKALGVIIFDIEFLIPNSVKIYKADFNCDGYWFKVREEGFTARGFDIQIKNIGGRLIFAAGEYDGRYPVMFRG